MCSVPSCPWIIAVGRRGCQAGRHLYTTEGAGLGRVHHGALLALAVKGVPQVLNVQGPCWPAPVITRWHCAASVLASNNRATKEGHLQPHLATLLAPLVPSTEASTILVLLAEHSA